jgi:hypothetical protein
MRTTFASVDDALIDRLFQPVSDMLAVRFGISRTSVTCFCIDLASIAWIVSRVSGLSAGAAQRNIAGTVLDTLLLLLGLTALISLRSLFRRIGRKQANPLRPAMQAHRGIALLMLMAGLLRLQTPGLDNASDVAMLVFAITALYLGACVQPPPLIRNWVTLIPTG